MIFGIIVLTTLVLHLQLKKDTETVINDAEEIDRLHKKLQILGKSPISTNCTKQFPQSIIIGVMKGGTEAFSTFLALHPRVAMQFAMLSTKFFTNQNYQMGFDWYRDQMPCSTEEQITVEKAPQYFPTPLAAKRIYEFNPKMQLILLVRKPIDRAVSHYLQQKDANPQRLSGETFETNILDASGNINPKNVFIQQSSYITILKEWLQYFKLEQILIIDGDDFRSDAVRELAKTETFLNIQPYINHDLFQYNTERKIYCIKSSKQNEDLCLPSGKGRQHPDIDPVIYEKLVNYFQPLNKQFMVTVGQTFDWE